MAHYFRSGIENRKKVLRNYVVGLGIFLILCAPWVTLISMKYGYFTISNMGKGNFVKLAPGLPQTEGFEFGNPLFHQGFFPPTNKTAISAWEDPSYVWELVEPWNPLNSFASLKHFIKNAIQNIFEILVIYQSFTRFAFVILLASILILFTQPFQKKMLYSELFFAFFTLILYSGGYLPFHLETRYLWIVFVILLLMGGHIVTLLLRSDFFSSGIRKNILILFFMISFIITPLKSYLAASKNNINLEMHNLSATLQSKYHTQGNIASNREWEHEPIQDSWHKTFRLSYWLNSRYYGQARQDITDKALENELRKYDIDYYFIWGADNRIPPFLLSHKEMTDNEIPGLKIYSLKELH
jgi:hypothetical protein